MALHLWLTLVDCMTSQHPKAELGEGRRMRPLASPPEEFCLSEAEKKLLLRLRQLRDTIVTVVVLNGEPLLLATPPKTERVASTRT